jgi:acetolactate synthase small subunit
MTERSIVVEIANSPDEIERIVTALQPYNVSEVVRTGLVAIKAED